MSTLEHAIAITAKAHEGQIDKAGVPYILHPLRMMMNLKTVDERIVAVLHDVVKYKLSDKNASLTALEKYLGIYKDDDRSTATLNIVINLS